MGEKPVTLRHTLVRYMKSSCKTQRKHFFLKGQIIQNCSGQLKVTTREKKHCLITVELFHQLSMEQQKGSVAGLRHRRTLGNTWRSCKTGQRRRSGIWGR